MYCFLHTDKIKTIEPAQAQVTQEELSTVSVLASIAKLRCG